MNYNSTQNQMMGGLPPSVISFSREQIQAVDPYGYYPYGAISGLALTPTQEEGIAMAFLNKACYAAPQAHHNMWLEASKGELLSILPLLLTLRQQISNLLLSKLDYTVRDCMPAISLAGGIDFCYRIDVDNVVQNKYIDSLKIKWLSDPAIQSFSNDWGVKNYRCFFKGNIFVFSLV